MKNLINAKFRLDLTDINSKNSVRIIREIFHRILLSKIMSACYTQITTIFLYSI